MTEGKNFHGPLAPGRAITQRMVDLLESQGVELPPARFVENRQDPAESADVSTVDEDQPYSEMFD